jgi:signal transduction histidine kinase
MKILRRKDEESAPEQPAEQPRAPERQPARRPATVDWKRFAGENSQLLSAAVLLVLGIVLLMLGWWGAAHTNIFTEQIPYLISGGLLGLGLIIAAGLVAYAAISQRATQQLRRDLMFLAQSVGGNGQGRSAEVAGRAETRESGQVFVVPGGRSYHVAGCPILEGKEGVKELEPSKAIGSGYTACKLCGP